MEDLDHMTDHMTEGHLVDDHGDELEGEDLLSPHHIVTLKSVGILVMMGLTTLFCILPYKTYSCEHRQRLISFANCFGGGVLFGTIFLHLIPEVSLQVNQYLEETGTEMPIPLAETLQVLGFCLILFLETLFDQISVRKLKRGILAEDCEKCEAKHNNLHASEKITTEQCNNQATQMDSTETVMIPADKNALLLVSNTMPKRCMVEKRSNLVLLLASLFTHSVFEGGAVGVETKAETVLGLMGAVLIHKCAIALTLGSRLVTQEVRFKTGCVYAVILSIGTPLGIVVGVAVESKLTGSTLLIVTAVIQALGTGIFLYITFAEILFPELKNKVDMGYKISCICLGILIIGCASLLHNHAGHDHGGGHAEHADLLHHDDHDDFGVHHD